MLWFKNDFKKVNRLLLSPIHRKPRILAIMDSVATALQSLSDKTLYEMQHDSRVIYLEKMLNEYFQVPTYNPNSHLATRQIYIDDVPQLAKTYIYQPEENNPVYLGTTYLDRGTGVNYQFIVKIPVAITFNELQLRAKIDFYKLGGKRYTIETY